MRTQVLRTLRLILCPVVLLAVFTLIANPSSTHSVFVDLPKLGSTMIRMQCTMFLEQLGLALHNDKRPDHRHAPLPLKPTKVGGDCLQAGSLHYEQVDACQ